MKKEYAVLGLGRFGTTMAKTLAQLGNDVIVVDMFEDKVNAIADEVSQAFICDVTNKGAFESLGINEVDVVIISFASNFEASVLATILCKELGIKKIISKATSNTHAEILKKVGADSVVIPEKDMAIRIAHNLTNYSIVKFFNVSEKYSIVELKVPAEWVGSNIFELDIRNRYGVNIMGIIKEDGKFIGSVSEGDIIEDKDEILMIGSNEQIALIKDL